MVECLENCILFVGEVWFIVCLGCGWMAVIGVDFSGKFPDAPPCYCVAVKGDRVFCVLMTGKAKRVVRRYKIRKELATAAHIYYAVKPLAAKMMLFLLMLSMTRNI